jgi:uncharacterized damage-inducible protein DinB
MFTLEGIRLFHGRAHGCLDVLIDHLRTLPPEVLNLEVSGFGHPTIRHQFVHLLSVETAWVCGLKNAPILRLSADENATLAALAESKARVSATTLEYIDGLTPLELNAEIAVLPDDWVGPPRSPAFILLHVLTHAFHHKGQMAAMLRMLRYPAPDTDLQRAE